MTKKRASSDKTPTTVAGKAKAVKDAVEKAVTGGGEDRKTEEHERSVEKEHATGEHGHGVEHEHHTQHRKSTIVDKIQGAALKIEGAITGQPGKKVLSSAPCSHPSVMVT